MVSDRGPSTILVGSDFSGGAAGALIEGRRLSRLVQAPLTVLHVEEPNTWPATARRNRWMSELGMDADDVAVRRGTAWVELIRYAAEVSAAMIVVGTHGLSGRHPLALGSTTSRLLLRARVPILVVASASFEAIMATEPGARALREQRDAARLADSRTRTERKL